jgi:hypothetical protein
MQSLRGWALFLRIHTEGKVKLQTAAVLWFLAQQTLDTTDLHTLYIEKVKDPRLYGRKEVHMH